MSDTTKGIVAVCLLTGLGLALMAWMLR